MLEYGRDLEEKLINLGFNEQDFYWLLPRTVESNENIRMRGIMLGARLTNRVIGEMISRDMNILIVSNYQEIPQMKLLELYADILYQNHAYILIWNWKWLYRSSHGIAILAKIFHTDFSQILRYNEQMILVQYDAKVNLTSILQRIEPILFSSHDISLDQIKSDKIRIIFDFTPSILQDLQSSREEILVMFSLPRIYSYLVQNQKHKIVLLDVGQFFTEVSRELYYLIKQRSYLNIDFSGNKEITVKNNGLDGI